MPNQWRQALNQRGAVACSALITCYEEVNLARKRLVYVLQRYTGAYLSDDNGRGPDMGR